MAGRIYVLNGESKLIAMGAQTQDGVAMGYETALHLIDVKIKSESLPVVKKALQTRKGPGLWPLLYFLGEAFMPNDGFLCFKSTRRYDSPYEPDDDDGTVTVLVGKWYEAEQIADWLKLHSQKRGAERSSRLAGGSLENYLRTNVHPVSYLVV